MRKLKLLLILLTLSICCSTFAQQAKDTVDVVRLMRKYLKNQSEENVNDFINIRVGNMLLREVELDQLKLNDFIKKNDVGAFFFEEYFNTASQAWLLLKSGSDYEIFSLSDWDEKDKDIDPRQRFETILNKLIDYFDRHTEIDRRLMPYYIREISDRYIINTFVHDTGMWNNWHCGPEFDYPRVPEKYKYGIDLNR